VSDYARMPRKAHDSEPPVILYLAWVERSKGVLDLIRAVHRFRSELEEARVVVCGGGSALTEAKELCRNLGVERVFSFPGWVHGDDKRRLLAGSHILVHPSHCEGMPNAVLEGMASGLAVVASRVGAIPDLVEDGRSGMLVEPGDADGLGRALVRLVQHPHERLRLGKAAREAVAREHDVEQAWRRILETMREAMAERRSDTPSAAW
jgi:glycosyltransferase involved in cell wall biosynthesis